MRAEHGRAGASDRFGVLRRQLPFAAVTLAAVLAALTWAPWTFREGRLVLPLVCALTATLLAAVVPWPRLPRSAAAAVPLLNLLAVALAEVADLPAGVLILLPVLVLARAGTHGLMLAIVAGVAASWAPVLLDPGPLTVSDDVLVELLLRPTVVVAAAIVLFVAERRAAARSALLAGQSALVEELLTDTRADRQLLETVLDTIQTKVIVFDGAGAISSLNRAAHRVYGSALPPGRRAEEVAVPLLGADGRTEIPPSQTPLMRASRGERFDGEIVWATRPDGTSAAYRASAAPLEGVSAGSVLALENLTRELEALAKREEFVSAVSHELRTPLTSVVGYVELALEDPGLGEAGRRNLQIAARNAGRLQILIENLLAAARGIERPTFEPVDLAAIVRDVVENQALRAGDATVTMRVDAPPQCAVQGDSDLLTQVVDNLVSNAIKYSLPGCQVAVTLTDDVAGPDTVQLRVRDQGRGIPEDELPHIFDRFFRARSARESSVQGTGLGLSITRQIVEDLGGTITLDSAVGEGTCVTVALPAGRSR